MDGSGVLRCRRSLRFSLQARHADLRIAVVRIKVERTLVFAACTSAVAVLGEGTSQGGVRASRGGRETHGLLVRLHGSGSISSGHACGAESIPDADVGRCETRCPLVGRCGFTEATGTEMPERFSANRVHISSGCRCGRGRCGRRYRGGGSGRGAVWAQSGGEAR